MSSLRSLQQACHIRWGMIIIYGKYNMHRLFVTWWMAAANSHLPRFAHISFYSLIFYSFGKNREKEKNTAGNGEQSQHSIRNVTISRRQRYSKHGMFRLSITRGRADVASAFIRYANERCWGSQPCLREDERKCPHLLTPLLHWGEDTFCSHLIASRALFRKTVWPCFACRFSSKLQSVHNYCWGWRAIS